MTHRHSRRQVQRRCAWALRLGRGHGRVTQQPARALARGHAPRLAMGVGQHRGAPVGSGSRATEGHVQSAPCAVAEASTATGRRAEHQDQQDVQQRGQQDALRQSGGPRRYVRPGCGAAGREHGVQADRGRAAVIEPGPFRRRGPATARNTAPRAGSAVRWRTAQPCGSSYRRLRLEATRPPLVRCRSVRPPEDCRNISTCDVQQARVRVG